MSASESRSKTSWQVALTFLPIVILVAASGWMLHQSTLRSLDLSNWIRHANEVIVELKEAQATLHEAESIQRAYILTEEVSRLDRYETSIERFYKHFRRIGELTVDNPVQRKVLQRVTPILEDRIALLNRIVFLKKAGDLPGATKLIRSNRGGEFMDHIRDAFRALETEESRLLDVRTDREIRETKTAQKWIFVTTVLGVFVLVLAASVIGRGIIERKRALVELTRGREMALKALAARSLFLANMSHEIRTPLHSIIGMAEVLADRPEEMETDRGLTIIRRAGYLLMNLINDVLDLSKIEAGKLEIDRSPFDLHAHIEETVSMIAFRASQKGLELTADIEKGVPQVLVGDSNRVRQILLNLLGNAIKFTHEGKVALRVGVVDAIAGAADRNPADPFRLFFEVVDTGIGIPKENHPFVFEKFRRLEPASSRSNGGTGLGLTISKQLVELMSGELTFRSEPGEGSAFRAEIPFEVRPGLSVAHEAKVWRSDRRALRILIVDDVEDNRLIAQLYLKHLPYRLEFARNGLEALDRVARARPDLVIMDMHMPKMSGYEAVQEIRRRERVEGISPIPIIALTASALREDAERSLSVGCNVHLTKPITREKLQRVILEVTYEIKARDPVENNEFGETIYLKRGLQTLIPSFRENSMRDLRDLIEAVDRLDYVRVASLAHTVQGVAGTFGFLTLSKAAAEMESAAEEGNHGRLQILSRSAYEAFMRVNIIYI